MVTGVIGEAFTFLAQFVGHQDELVDVTSPVIDVFYLDENGDQVVLADAASMSQVSTGVYAYAYTPTGLDHGTMIYGAMSGTWGAETLRANQSVLLHDNRTFRLRR